MIGINGMFITCRTLKTSIKKQI
uniref:Uncharacterized protein n=1 Tax=Rhizophora mucronata TaxID=61149 RepID=A0A2P2PVG2_RHIMU